VAATTVQVVGLQRWVTLVPGISRDALNPTGREAAEDRFELLYLVLGKLIGETLGYALPQPSLSWPSSPCPAPSCPDGW